MINQSTIFEQRYLNSVSTVSKAQHTQWIEEGARQFGLTFRTGLFYGDINPLCEWLNANTWVEPSLYDYEVPLSYVTPVHFFDQPEPWKIVTWVYNPNTCQPNEVFLNARNLDRWMREKDEPYMIRSLLLDHHEVGWVGYDDVDGLILVHHIQVKGSLSGVLTRNQLTWLYRYMIRMFCCMVPRDRLKDIVVPDSATFQRYMQESQGFTQIPHLPFSRHVLQRSQFERITHGQLLQEYPNAMSKLLITDYIPTPEQNYWRYEYANPHALAYQHID